MFDWNDLRYFLAVAREGSTLSAAKALCVSQPTVQRRLAASVGREVRVLVDGPASEHELVLQGRTEGQAPDIDSVVYLTDCDPTAYRAGDLVQVRIVGGRGYDLVAAPIA